MHKYIMMCVAVVGSCIAGEITSISYEFGLFADRLLLYSPHPLNGFTVAKPPYQTDNDNNKFDFFLPYASISSAIFRQLPECIRLTIKQVSKPVSGLMCTLVYTCNNCSCALRPDLHPIYGALVLELHKKEPLRYAREYFVDQHRG